MKSQLSEEYYEYISGLEKEWRKSSSKKVTDKELLEIFPEAKAIIPIKLKEYEKTEQDVRDVIKRKMILINNATNDEFSRWFWKKWLKVNEGAEFLKIKKHILRLKRLLLILSGKTQKGSITEEQLEQARSTPIESLIDQPLRRSGRTLVGLCPLHKERHPSFHIYTETNSYYCFGCNQGGDSINFIRLLHGYSFKEAVAYLIK